MFHAPGEYRSIVSPWTVAPQDSMMGAAEKACVIFNPVSGRGRSRRMLSALRTALPATTDLIPISAAGAGEATACAAIAAGYRTIIAAGGDGTLNDVVNAIMQADRPEELVLGLWPLGSANDFAFALGIERPWEKRGPRRMQRVDVGLVELENGRRRFYVNSLGVGFNCAVTLAARKIKWLRGPLLYGLGILQAMRRQFNSPAMRVTVDGVARELPTLSLTINLGKREGGFPLTPLADVADGLCDILHVGDVSRWELLRHLPGMAFGKIPDDHPKVWKCQARDVLIESPTPLRIHLDGEFLCHPEDEVRRAAVRVLPSALLVQTH